MQYKHRNKHHLFIIKQYKHMKELKFKKLVLENFKGVKNMELELSGITNIYGANGTYKTTIADAITWLFTGKNSNGESDFNIKTLDSDNNPIHHLNHSVYVECDLDGELIELKRVFQENWVSKRGETIPVLKSHITKYFGNENSSISASEFNNLLNSITEPIAFKLLTDPLAFNSDFKPKLSGWMARRELLFEMAGEITDEDIASGNESYMKLLEVTKRTKLKDYKNALKSTVSEKKKTLKELPARIDENVKSMPEADDYEFLEKEIERLELEIKNVDDQIEDSSKVDDSVLDAIKKRKTEILSITGKIGDLRQQLQSEANKGAFEWEEKKKDLSRKLSSYQTELTGYKISLSNTDNEIITKEKTVNGLREKWVEINKTSFESNEQGVICPISKNKCGDSSMVVNNDELEKKFNIQKSEDLKSIDERGLQLVETINKLKKDKEDYEKAISETETLIVNTQNEIKKLEQNPVTSKTVEDSQEIINLQEQANKIRQSIPEIKPVDNSELKAKKEALKVELKNIETRLLTRKTIEEKTGRIEQLKGEIETVRQEISDKQKQINIIDSFIKEKVSRVEESVNSMFRMVRFKMYEMQLNDGEREICECIYDGVPFKDLNNARKIQCGIDIINTLQKHYGIILPIVIDNRESVIEIPETKGQVINLIVSKPDKVLRIENV